MAKLVESINHQSKVVIGVDDAAEIRLHLKTLLASHGYIFLGAGSGQECLTLLGRVIPRLILLDIQMPTLDGFETCAKIRASAELRQIPIAFLTARKSLDDFQAGIAAGGNDFILKPFDEPHLLDRVAYWTTRRAIDESTKARIARTASSEPELQP